MFEQTKSLFEKELQFQKIQQNVQALEEKKQQLFQLQKQHQQLEETKKAYENALEEYLSIQEEVFESRNRFQILEQQFMDGQAGILSQTLKKGMACPVCGSTEHPKPAVFIWTTNTIS